MKLLVTGKGGSAGSWQIRGEQLGAAIGADVKPMASAEDMRAADLTIVVKRTPTTLLSALRSSEARWVLDLVDCYPQPEAMRWGRTEAIGWVRKRLADLRPNAVIWPTQHMREDCDVGLPGMVLKHHHRPAIAPNPIRDAVTVVAYEGRAQYLNGWAEKLTSECRRRGWRFMTDPQNLSDADIVVALRGGEWDGYVARHWKSNVKLANAHGSGTPFVGQRESGYSETSTGAEYWADSMREMVTAFDWLESKSAREQISDRFREAAYPVEKAANDLVRFLEDLA